MMDTLANRLKTTREEQGLSQQALANKAGCSQALIGNLEADTQKASSKIPSIAGVLGVEALWLAEGKGPKRYADFETHIKGAGKAQFYSEESNVIVHHHDDPLPADMVSVQEYRVSFSAGNGRTPEYELVEEAEPATFRLSWFHKNHINPANVKRFKVAGDSMEPFLYSNDSVLVNLAENDPTRIIEGKVYALRYGNALRVKRLYRKLDGTLVLRSENPAYPDEVIPPEMAEEHISIIGRVRDKSGGGGL